MAGKSLNRIFFPDIFWFFSDIESGSTLLAGLLDFYRDNQTPSDSSACLNSRRVMNGHGPLETTSLGAGPLLLLWLMQSIDNRGHSPVYVNDETQMLHRWTMGLAQDAF